RVLQCEQRGAQYPLALSAAAADRLQTDTACRILLKHCDNFRLNLSRELFNGVEIEPLLVGSVKNLICQILKGEFFVIKYFGSNCNPVFLHELEEFFPCPVLLYQGTRSHVIDTGGYAYADLKGRPLRFVLLARISLSP